MFTSCIDDLLVLTISEGLNIWNIAFLSVKDDDQEALQVLFLLTREKHHDSVAALAGPQECPEDRKVRNSDADDVALSASEDEEDGDSSCQHATRSNAAGLIYLPFKAPFVQP